MPKQIRYCTDNCGPGMQYRKRCPLHYGVNIYHVGAEDFKDEKEIPLDHHCVAARGHRLCTLKKERVDYNGEPI